MKLNIKFLSAVCMLSLTTAVLADPITNAAASVLAKEATANVVADITKEVVAAGAEATANVVADVTKEVVAAGAEATANVVADITKEVVAAGAEATANVVADVTKEVVAAGAGNKVSDNTIGASISAFATKFKELSCETCKNSSQFVRDNKNSIACFAVGCAVGATIYYLVERQKRKAQAKAGLKDTLRKIAGQ